MIEIKFKFQRSAVENVFRGRRFLLETIAGVPLGHMDEASCFHAIDRTDLSGKSDFRLGVLRTHQPIEVVRFCGCTYFKNQWWVAKIKLQPLARSTVGTIFFVATGWTNEFHGTSASIVGDSVKESIADEWLSSRLTAKVSNGYDVEAELENIPLVISTKLPKIAGLPSLENVFAEDDPMTHIPAPSLPRPRIMPTVSVEPTEPVVPVVEPAPPVSKKRSKADVSRASETKKREEKEEKERLQRKKKREDAKKKKANSIKEMMASRKKESDW